MRILSPEGWPRPKGFSHGVAAEGRLVFVAGQVGWDPLAESFESDDFVGQARQALENTVVVLRTAGARPEHITRMTWYVTDREEYRTSMRDLGKVYREVIGAHYPAMALVEVSALTEDRARVEIETTAVIPAEGESG